MQTLNPSGNQTAFKRNTKKNLNIDAEEIFQLCLKQWEIESPEIQTDEELIKLINSKGSMIEDSFNNLLMFIHYTDMEVVKGHINNGKVLTLEEYTEMTTEELERIEPGFTTEYNALVDKFKNPDLTYELLHIILDEAIVLKHSRDWYHSYI
ncbi:MAG: hypothetical protein IPL31_05805 [Saprospiraceae bacterium]|nr:hypothetical protein [Saprospiraceae bacterium]